MCGSMADVQSPTAEIRRGKKEERRARMWVNAQRDGRPAEHRWRPLFNAAKFGWRPLLDAVQLRYQDAKPVEICRVASNYRIDFSRYSGPTFTILCGHVEDILLLNIFFRIVDACLICEDIPRQICAMVPRWRFLATFFASCIFGEPRAAGFRPAS